MQKKTNKNKSAYDIKEILLSNLPAAILVFFMALALKISLKYSLIVCFLILLVAYFVLGLAVEWILEKIAIRRAAGMRHQTRRPDRVRKVVRRPLPDSRAHTAASDSRFSEKETGVGQTFFSREQEEAREYAPALRGLTKTGPEVSHSRSRIQELKPERQPTKPEQDRLVRTKTTFSDYKQLDDSFRPGENSAQEQSEAFFANEAVKGEEVRKKPESGEPSPLFDFAIPYHPIKDAEQRKTEKPPKSEESLFSEPEQETEKQDVVAGGRTASADSRSDELEIQDIEEINRTSEAIVNEVSKRLDRRASSRLRDLRPVNLSYVEESQPDDFEEKPENALFSQESDPSPAIDRMAAESGAENESRGEKDLDLDWRGEPLRASRDKVRADRSKVDDLFEEWQEERPKKQNEKERSGFLGFLKKKEQIGKVDEEFRKKETGVSSSYSYPPIDLLKIGRRRQPEDLERLEAEQRQRADKLISTLQSFGVGAKVIGITSGPAVTRFEIQPDSGVKVSKIVSLSDDISLNLASSGVRIEAPIPGKAAIGIEIPNREVDTVYLRDVVDTAEYRDCGTNIPCALGRDIAGNVVIGDIAKMPHLLIAGSTGSGKSVCINTIIASILYKATPEEVRFIMVDPKVVELGIYNGIPHLLVPVVTNPKKAASAVAWAVGEVERRYALFAQYNVRDLRSYNQIDSRRKDAGEERLPQIVIIIDELADLMMVASKDIEDSIIRLAQKARAAGVHLVIATQRPSVDVITGLIKANIPSRIAFAVTSQIDSRTILDGAGAEKLLGRGDMLYHPLGQSKPKRVQGAFVSDSEIESLVDYIKRNAGEAEYSQEVTECLENEVKNNGFSSGREESEEGDDDALVKAAAELAFEFNQLSASFLQRKLKVGYSRAARLIDLLEDRGLLSSADGSKPRQILLTREEWAARC